MECVTARDDHSLDRRELAAVPLQQASSCYRSRPLPFLSLNVNADLPQSLVAVRYVGRIAIRQ